MIVKIDFNPAFKGANFTKKRYRAMKGSAGSGKSVNVAQDYILKLGDKKYQGANLLVVRKSEATHKYSTYAELTGAINRIYGKQADKYWKTTLNPLEIKSKVTGNSIIFRGVNDAKQREKLKSINFSKGKLTWVWCEEATELMESDIDILDDRLRGILTNINLYYQMTFTFNPVSATHWIKRKYFDYKNDDIFTHHSTYLQNRFIDEAYYRRMQMRKEQDPEGYKVYGLGEWGETGGAILKNYVIHEFPTEFEYFDNMRLSQDFGFNHANAILRIGFKDGELYICNEIYVHEMDTSEIIKIANSKGLEKNLFMYCDSAEPDRIKMWKSAGYKAKGVKKGPGSVKAQIDYLKQLRIHVHPSCTNTIKEIQQWKWKQDERTGLYLDEPVEFMDDAMAALRYSIDNKLKNNGISFLK
ncbi:PBSX family phage terminase large subunit [Clostridioides difficile]|uniref:PBSX family phage terminase large subunit n=1 Tax=Clostridioides difficile TaxID=1496 RepID=UPI000D1FCB60|nr:PBSX family phage terminase large subunit [Clostridioides difficile]MCZ1036401.1 PBSX family phage terminase large subunit [Clostridioides difficile]MDM0363853.1 PBSX family phage terminase large subunit [Clostridioides difficile]MDM0363926.1 PBSX family phage terminase large subunit [Clostridioides difficile]MDM9785665.1 PBSX family phage terminase large subunit [Clostridioides difficile]MDM9785738.1 PBSX family phage terminase large subunit [Clostridioides difficile]